MKTLEGSKVQTVQYHKWATSDMVRDRPPAIGLGDLGGRGSDCILLTIMMLEMLREH